MREFGYDGETTTGGVKKALLRISQISQENTCVGVFFLIKLENMQLQNTYSEEHLRMTAFDDKNAMRS